VVEALLTLLKPRTPSDKMATTAVRAVDEVPLRSTPIRPSHTCNSMRKCRMYSQNGAKYCIAI
jgi:hypothetical protein